MRRRDFLTGLAGLAAGGLVAAPATAAGDWDFLGSRTVRWLTDRDVIHVGAGQGRYDRIMLSVKGNGVFIEDIDVVYTNGGHDHIVLRFHIPEGGQSRVINLRLGDRNIRRVEFSYRRPGDFDGPATVELWGQR